MSEAGSPLLAKESTGRDGWRVAYLHVNALLPAVVVAIALGVFHSALLAIFAFHGICLVAMPALFISSLPRDERGATGFEVYHELVRTLGRQGHRLVGLHQAPAHGPRHRLRAS